MSQPDRPHIRELFLEVTSGRIGEEPQSDSLSSPSAPSSSVYCILVLSNYRRSLLSLNPAATFGPPLRDKADHSHSLLPETFSIFDRKYFLGNAISSTIPSKPLLWAF